MRNSKIKTDKKRIQIRLKKIPRFKIPFYYIYRVFLFTFTIGIIVLIMLVGQKPYIVGLHEGDISSRDIYSPFNFEYIIGKNEKLTKQRREEARRKAGEVYLKKDRVEEIINEFQKFYERLNQYKKNPTNKLYNSLWELSKSALNKNQLKIIIESDINEEKFLSQIKEIFSQFYLKNYIISDKDLERLKADGADKIYLKTNDKLLPVEIDDPRVMGVKKASKLIGERIIDSLPYRKSLNRVFSLLLISYFKPNLEIDKSATEVLKEEASLKVKPVYIKGQVKKNERIVARGDRIEKEELLKLKRMSELEGPTRKSLTFGMGISTILLLFFTALLLKAFDSKFYKDNSKMTLIALVLILIVIFAKVVVVLPIPSYLVPVAGGAMLVTMLVSPSVALKLIIVMAFLAGIIGGNDLNHSLTFLLGGLVAIIGVKDVKRRSQLLKAGIVVGGSQAITIAGIDLISNLSPDVSLNNALVCFGNGIISSFLVLGLLPFFEHTFRIVTNISLLELSDLNHPLLKQLLTKAPGTYHHSLIVSQLAEQAAEAISANALLARVGAYFHDIGKLEKPEYFSENLDEKRKSKHEKLSPSMSSLIIINHVKVGVELAKKYKLPQAIIDFIEQHHGTSLVYFFYHKALEKAPEGIKEEQFRYAGPKPQNKEVATVLLADAVEAASRSLTEPTPARVKRLVMQIIDAKFMEGELDECELTLKDLHIIAEVFSKILTGIYHTRVGYPVEKIEKTSRNKNRE